MRHATRGGMVAALLVLGVNPPVWAQAPNGEIQVDPALGRRPIFGPGGFLSNGNGSTAQGPRGPGYYTGLYQAPNDLSNGPSPYYSPLYTAIEAGPRTGQEPPVLPKPKPAKGIAGVPTRLGNLLFRHR